VVRGGSWRSIAEECRSAIRPGFSPQTSRDDLSFRLCLKHPAVEALNLVYQAISANTTDFSSSANQFVQGESIAVQAEFSMLSEPSKSGPGLELVHYFVDSKLMTIDTNGVATSFDSTSLPLGSAMVKAELHLNSKKEAEVELGTIEIIQGD
jgi:hypothetical protein